MGVTIKREVSNVTKNLKNLKSGYVDVGWFPSARYNDEKSTPVASVAEENEYGNPAKNIPARPFLRPAISNYQKDWNEIGKRGLKAVLNGKSTVTQVLDNLGQRIVGDIQHSISKVYEPVLSEVTINARLERRTHKGRLNKTQAVSITKPLIDTGHMQATVSYEIQGGT